MAKYKNTHFPPREIIFRRGKHYIYGYMDILLHQLPPQTPRTLHKGTLHKGGGAEGPPPFMDGSAGSVEAAGAAKYPYIHKRSIPRGE